MNILSLFIDDLLKRTILKNANTLSLSENLAIAAMQKGRANYVINVLRLPSLAQNQVRLAATALSLPPFNSLGAIQLLATMKYYNTLSIPDKAKFIEHFATRAALMIGVPDYISRKKLWSGDDVPPPNLGGGRLPPRGRL